MTDWNALESPLDPVPLFLVEAPGKPGTDPRLWPEAERQAAFISYLRRTSPKIIARAIRNEGKRGMYERRQMKRTGLLAGTFDTLILWDMADATSDDCPRSVAMIEFKGFDKNGRPGKLSPQQIEFGNDLHKRGHAAACFYTASAAIDWLASLGAPIRGRIVA